MTSGLPVLTYHALEATRNVLATDPAWFAETLAALHESGFRTIDLAEWVELGRPALAKRFAITLDDGLTSVHRAAEVLQRYGFQATAFLVTGRMGRDNAWPGQPRGVPLWAMLEWRDLPDLLHAGVHFQAHTVSHVRLDVCTDAQLDWELQASRDAIEQRLGRPCRLLAYPYGKSTARIRNRAARHFRSAFGTNLSFTNANENLYNLSRIDAFYLSNERDLQALISGRWHASLKTRRLLRSLRQGLREKIHRATLGTALNVDGRGLTPSRIGGS